MTHPTLAFDGQFAGPCLGLDEVGYGPWAGPVVVCAVLITDFYNLQSLEGKVQDSKKLTPKKRETLFEALTTHPNVTFNIGMAHVEEIDALNVRRATCVAMERAYDHVAFQEVRTLLVDGTLPLAHPQAKVVPIVKGDTLSFSIACAAIIAKVTRDQLMYQLHKDFPHYGWDTNVGYGTTNHQAGLKRVGISPHHRKSYAPIRALLHVDKMV